MVEFSTTAATPRPHALVLGIGNVLWADEGFGIRTVERFFERFEPDETIEVVDGGTRGMALLPLVQEADALVIFDAVDFDLQPGELKHLSGDEVPAFLGAKKMSLHQTGFQEVLVLAELTGEIPRHVHLIGVQPELLEDYGGGLTPVVAQQIEAAVTLGAKVLRERRGPYPCCCAANRGSRDAWRQGAARDRLSAAGPKNGERSGCARPFRTGARALRGPAPLRRGGLPPGR